MGMMKEQLKSVLSIYSDSPDHNRYSFCFVCHEDTENVLVKTVKNPAHTSDRLKCYERKFSVV